ncbi:translocating chain-associated membrane protein 1 [Chironomus tepperi]|uniref:translocating chain-associated membrane protein 1 n=1 Tax=Chironomus tepperi TaxID=113505 RepID=UPI00391F89D3
MSSALRTKPFGSKKDKKNPPILSHEFVIQNHADIVSCVAMVFVVGLMMQATSTLASIFIVMGHNATDPTDAATRGEPFLYESGWRDGPAVFFYTLICIIMHAILQEYVLDKVSKKLHLSKFKLSRFNESGQLVVFYLISFLWGGEVMLRERYAENMSKLWVDYPVHPMTFLHKLYFIIQLAYYLHMLPELYFQKVKKDEQSPKIQHSIAGLFIIGFFYFFAYRRVAIVLLTLHYFSEFVSHTFGLLEVFDKDEKYARFRIFNNIIFLITAFSTLVLSFLTFFTGIGKTNPTRGMLGLVIAFTIQGFLIFRFITSFLKSKRESKELASSSAKPLLKKPKSSEKKSESSKKSKKESDLPEADQNVNQKKVKTK